MPTLVAISSRSKLPEKTRTKKFLIESRRQWADADTLDGFPVCVEDALRLTLLQSILVISHDDDDCEP